MNHFNMGIMKREIYKINYENQAAVINYELLFFYINCAIKNVDFINFIIVMTLKH